MRHGDRVWSARHVLLRRLLACADLLAGLCASAALTALDGGSASLAWALVCLPSWIVVAKVLGLYDEDERSLRHLTVDELPRLVVWALAGVAALSLALELTPAGRPDASQAVAAGFVALGAVISLRALSRLLWRRVVPPERVALVGAADRVAAVRRKLELLPGVHVDVVVELEAGDLEAIVRSLGDVDRVVLAPATLDDPEVPRLVPLLRRAQTTLTVVPPSSWPLTPAVRLRHLAELPLLEYGKQDLSRSTLLLKRLLDVGVSVAALAFLLPLFALIAVAIALD
ncbi:MAG TPA: hypothetical protein VNJ53_02150, partial [Gaiellaceae bacterium]|nr:hypothetical protein [Gaiellaceae bacterium]